MFTELLQVRAQLRFALLSMIDQELVYHLGELLTTWRLGYSLHDLHLTLK